MNPLAELDQLNLEPAAKTQVAAMLQALLEQTVRDAKLIQAKETAIQAKDVKIAALTHELAYYKRIRFATRSEALAPLQRDVFEETWNTGISAIEAEVEQLRGDLPGDTVARPKRSRAGRHKPYRIICPASNIATNRNPAAADTAAGTTLPNIWTSNRPSFSCIATFARNMPAAPVKPSRRLYSQA